MDFCSKFSVSNMSVGAQYPTKCVTCSAPTLTYINLAYGNGNAIAWLIWQLTFFQEQINVPNKMTNVQLETCAQCIFDGYHHLKTTEIMLFLARLCGGMYPVDWHGYVTPTEIVSALREHFMPWRNNLLYKIDKQREERERESQLRDKDLMTREEYEEIKMLTRMYEMEINQKSV